jgi:hypothetical protein
VAAYSLVFVVYRDLGAEWPKPSMSSMDFSRLGLGLGWVVLSVDLTSLDRGYLGGSLRLEERLRLDF